MTIKLENETKQSPLPSNPAKIAADALTAGFSSPKMSTKPDSERRALAPETDVVSAAAAGFIGAVKVMTTEPATYATQVIDSVQGKGLSEDFQRKSAVAAQGAIDGGALAAIRKFKDSVTDSARSAGSAVVTGATTAMTLAGDTYTTVVSQGGAQTSSNAKTSTVKVPETNWKELAKQLAQKSEAAAQEAQRLNPAQLEEKRKANNEKTWQAVGDLFKKPLSEAAPALANSLVESGAVERELANRNKEVAHVKEAQEKRTREKGPLTPEEKTAYDAMLEWRKDPASMKKAHTFFESVRRYESARHVEDMQKLEAFFRLQLETERAKMELMNAMGAARGGMAGATPWQMGPMQGQPYFPQPMPYYPQPGMGYSPFPQGFSPYPQGMPGMQMMPPMYNPGLERALRQHMAPLERDPEFNRVMKTVRELELLQRLLGREGLDDGVRKFLLAERERVLKEIEPGRGQAGSTPSNGKAEIVPVPLSKEEKREVLALLNELKPKDIGRTTVRGSDTEIGETVAKKLQAKNWPPEKIAEARSWVESTSDAGQLAK